MRKFDFKNNILFNCELFNPNNVFKHRLADGIKIYSNRPFAISNIDGYEVMVSDNVRKDSDGSFKSQFGFIVIDEKKVFLNYNMIEDLGIDVAYIILGHEIGHSNNRKNGIGYDISGTFLDEISADCYGIFYAAQKTGKSIQEVCEIYKSMFKYFYDGYTTVWGESVLKNTQTVKEMNLRVEFCDWLSLISTVYNTTIKDYLSLAAWYCENKRVYNADFRNRN